jgi:hypothetical protein
MGDALVAFPATKPTALLLTSGSLKTDPDQIAIIKSLVDTARLEGKTLQTQSRRDKSICERTQMVGGLYIIYPDVDFILPSDIPFLPLFAKISNTG